MHLPDLTAFEYRHPDLAVNAADDRRARSGAGRERLDDFAATGVAGAFLITTAAMVPALVAAYRESAPPEPDASDACG